ncbi:MAG: hypothetical protein ACRDKB_04295 [Actinomycetota bacterium]
MPARTRAVGLLLLALLTACGSSGAGDAYEEFQEGIAEGAPCSELFSLRNELDPDDERIPDMNDQLRDVGCFSSGSDRTEDGATGDRFSDPLVQNTYEVAVLVCGDAGPKAIAKEFGAPADDLDAIARAYSTDLLKEGPHRDAGYVGCLEGLVDF